MRSLFSDGVNSLAHVVLGAAAMLTFPLLGTGLFLVYQLSEGEQVNTAIDIAEFVAGAAGALVLLT